MTRTDGDRRKKKESDKKNESKSQTSRKVDWQANLRRELETLETLFQGVRPGGPGRMTFYVNVLCEGDKRDERRRYDYENMREKMREKGTKEERRFMSMYVVLWPGRPNSTHSDDKEDERSHRQQQNAMKSVGR